MKPEFQFSVIVPLFNKRQYIRRAVDSALSQTFDRFELLVIDDGSTDGSLDELSDLKDRRVRIIRQENMGGAGGQARNTGMKEARGSWFAFLDGDDMWLPNHLEEIARIVEKHPEPGLVSPRPLEAKTGSAIAPDNRERSDIRRIDYFLEASKNIGVNNASSTAIHRKVFETVGGFVLAKSGPDLEYWARIALDFPVYVSNRVTSVYFRDTNGNMEQIAKDRSIRKAPPTKLREISPSIAMLCDRAEKTMNLWNDSSIRAYVNSRLMSGMKISLHRGDLEFARGIAMLTMPPLSLKLQIYKWILKLPNESPYFFISAYKTLSRMNNHN